MSDESELNVNGVNVRVTNLKKVFYPRTGFTKGDVIDYYIRVSPFLLPHLHNRPITLNRYPDGVDGFFFYEKECPSPHSKWVKTAKTQTSSIHSARALPRLSSGLSQQTRNLFTTEPL
jgi:bifunctional non-homologous end joining protein LigD